MIEEIHKSSCAHKVLIIDNYDSFTFNLVHKFKELNCEVHVWKNDEFQLENVNEFQKIVLSPGPGVPKDAGLLIPTIQKYAATKSILGVCLGLQAIVEAFGGTLKNLQQVFHGVATPIKLCKNDTVLFHSIDEEIKVGRYHSWVANKLPRELEITATDQQGEIMSIRHKYLDVRAVQFHPESILTPLGKQILRNWLDS